MVDSTENAVWLPVWCCCCAAPSVASLVKTGVTKATVARLFQGSEHDDSLEPSRWEVLLLRRPRALLAAVLGVCFSLSLLALTQVLPNFHPVPAVEVDHINARRANAAAVAINWALQGEPQSAADSWDGICLGSDTPPDAWEYNVSWILVVSMCLYGFLSASTRSFLMTFMAMCEAAFSQLCALAIWYLLCTFFWWECPRHSGIELAGILLAQAIASQGIYIYAETWKRSGIQPAHISHKYQTRLTWTFRQAGRSITRMSLASSVCFVATGFSPVPVVSTFGWTALLIVLVDLGLALSFVPAVFLVTQQYVSQSSLSSQERQEAGNFDDDEETGSQTGSPKADSAILSQLDQDIPIDDETFCKRSLSVGPVRPRLTTDPSTVRLLRETTSGWMQLYFSEIYFKRLFGHQFITVAVFFVIAFVGLVSYHSHWHSAHLVPQFLHAQYARNPTANSLRYGFYEFGGPAVVHLVFGLDQESPLGTPSSGFWAGPLHPLEKLGEPNFDPSFADRAQQQNFQEDLLDLCNNISSDQALVEPDGTYCIAQELQAFATEQGLPFPLEDLAGALQNPSFRPNASSEDFLRTGAKVDSDGKVRLVWISFNAQLRNSRASFTQTERLLEGSLETIQDRVPSIDFGSIVEAWYGAQGHEWDSRYGSDVTMLLKSWLQSDARVDASSAYFGDTCTGTAKVLLVNRHLYEHDASELHVEGAHAAWAAAIERYQLADPGLFQTSSVWLWLRTQQAVANDVWRMVLMSWFILVPVLWLADDLAPSCQSLMYSIFIFACVAQVTCMVPSLMAFLGLGVAQYGTVGPVQAISMSIAVGLAVRNPVYVLRECQLAMDSAPTSLKADEVLREALASASMSVVAWSGIHFMCGFLLALRPEYALLFELGIMFAITAAASCGTTMLLLAVLLAAYYDDFLEHMGNTRSMFASPSMF